MSDEPINGTCECEHPIDHHAYSKGRCLECGCSEAVKVPTRIDIINQVIFDDGRYTWDQAPVIAMKIERALRGSQGEPA